jgi:UDP-N-acetylglucosamine 2-epimerase (non-hydrolysing)
MRILVATDQWFPDVLGGAARVAAESARHLAAQGHEIVVLAPARAEPAAEDTPVVIHRVLNRSVLPQTLTDIFSTRRAARSAGDGFDLLLAHQTTTALGLAAAFPETPLALVYHASAAREARFARARRGGLRRVLGYPLAGLLAAIERRAVRRADLILVLSDFSRSLLLADHDVDPARVRKVTVGVDTERFSPGDRTAARQRLGLDPSGEFLFTVRRLEPRMGLDSLLHALALGDVGASLAIAGTGSMRGQLEKLAAQLGLNGRVQFLGQVPDDELPDWYRAADAFVLPTAAYEGFGMVTAEALACGTPVVGTPVGATPELLEPLEPAFVAAGAEPGDIATAVGRVLHSAVDEKLRDRCRLYAAERFSWPRAVIDWEAALQAGRAPSSWVAPEVSKAGARMRPRPAQTDFIVVAGARPNFMKAASIVHAAESAGLSYALVHTGQHYDRELSEVFFEELALPRPDVYLGVGSASHAEQTARIMLAFEAELLRLDPAVVVVVGDVNSTLACALVAVKERYPVAHVEAGLRCGDAAMAEEINRKLCDHVAEYLFTTSPDADENLLREGVPGERIVFVGNTMIDTLLRFAESARSRNVPERMGLGGGPYAIATLHRPENVESAEVLAGLVDALTKVAARIPVILPLHPRTAARLSQFGLDELLEAAPGIHTSPPIGYLDFIGLLADARLVLTDSGGVQEEATVLGVPCLTLRDSTERPVTVEMGTNRVVGRDSDAIVAASLAVIQGIGRPGRIPELWDGRAGERIVDRLRDEIYGREEAASAHA